MNRSTLATHGFVALCVLLSGCGEGGPKGGSAWQAVAPDVMSEGQNIQRDKALKAMEAMFTALKGRLMEVMGSRGPVEAIAVCSKEAPQIAEQISREHGVAIGRTSFRLRNQKNKPPAWAAGPIADHAGEPLYFTHDGRLAALLPIRLQAPCLVCHGPEDGMPPAVREAIAEHYPGDQATGFQEGDLRGWFWVEVPAAAGS